MRAEITQVDEGYKAVFERKMGHEAEEVWDMLTDNSRLKQWFDELHIAEKGKGGKLIFDMGDGTSVDLAITDFEECQVFAFKWWAGHVRFEISRKDGGRSKLRLIETIERITPQTAKDLAGWHVCLDVIEAVLNGNHRDLQRRLIYSQGAV